MFTVRLSQLANLLRGGFDELVVRGFRQVDETRRVGRAWGKLLLYYTLGSDPALWPAGERWEGEHITHDKDIIIHIWGEAERNLSAIPAI